MLEFLKDNSGHVYYVYRVKVDTILINYLAFKYWSMNFFFNQEESSKSVFVGDDQEPPPQPEGLATPTTSNPFQEKDEKMTGQQKVARRECSSGLFSQIANIS